MFSIRPLAENDPLDPLVALSRAFFAEYEEHHEHFFLIDRLRRGDILSTFGRWIGDKHGEVFVAVCEGEIVGYIAVTIRQQAEMWQVKQVGHISGLMVRSDHRRRGIGRQLLAEAGAFFGSRGVDQVAVSTAVVNRPALELYAQVGMRPLTTMLLGDVRSLPNAQPSGEDR